MKFHPTNPRIIDPASRRALREAMKRGYVGGIVWNRRTGHLVGGNQRIDVLDELHKGQDYALEIDVVDVDETTEKTLLVSLNNLGMQGDWDLDPLGKVLLDIKTGGGDLLETGFTKLDLDELFPSLDAASLFSDEKESASVKADVAQIEQMKQKKKASYQEGKKREDADFTVTLVFGDADEKRRCLDRIGLEPKDGYVDGRAFALACGVDLDKGE